MGRDRQCKTHPIHPVPLWDGQKYPFGQGHTFAGVDYMIDWMHEQDVIAIRTSWSSPSQSRRGGRTCGSIRAELSEPNGVLPATWVIAILAEEIFEADGVCRSWPVRSEYVHGARSFVYSCGGSGSACCTGDTADGFVCRAMWRSPDRRGCRIRRGNAAAPDRRAG